MITYQKPKKILLELISEIALQNVWNKFTFQLITGFQFTFGIVRFVIAGGVHTYADNTDDTLGKNSFDS